MDGPGREWYRDTGTGHGAACGPQDTLTQDSRGKPDTLENSREVLRFAGGREEKGKSLESEGRQEKGKEGEIDKNKGSERREREGKGSK